ncbi:MAG: STAS domain-containing protein [Candidatus Kryptoniota bacterium]
MNEFKVLTRDSGKAVIVKLHGFLDAHTAPDLEKVFSELIKGGKFNIVVNFRDLNYISSAGLGVFMAFIDEVRSNNGDIKLAELQPKVYNVFDLLGFPILYEIYSSQEEALEKFNS